MVSDLVGNLFHVLLDYKPSVLSVHCSVQFMIIVLFDLLKFIK